MANSLLKFPAIVQLVGVGEAIDTLSIGYCAFIYAK